MDTPKHNNTCILPCFPQRALPSAVNQNNTHTCEYLHSVLSKPINTLSTDTVVYVSSLYLQKINNLIKIKLHFFIYCNVN